MIFNLGQVVFSNNIPIPILFITNRRDLQHSIQSLLKLRRKAEDYPEKSQNVFHKKLNILNYIAGRGLV